MSIRQGIFRIGELVEITGTFTDAAGAAMTPTSAKLYIRKPDQTLIEFDLVPSNGAIGLDVPADMVGRWHVRLECSAPSVAVMESKFEVVSSTVLD